MYIDDIKDIFDASCDPVVDNLSTLGHQMFNSSEIPGMAYSGVKMKLVTALNIYFSHGGDIKNNYNNVSPVYQRSSNRPNVSNIIC